MIATQEQGPNPACCLFCIKKKKKDTLIHYMLSVYGCFCNITTELRSCDRELKPKKPKLFPTFFFTEKVC